MAFTIRELSSNAEESLDRLMENNKSILKTKTKAIDYVLSNYYRNRSHINELESENKKLQEKMFKYMTELVDLKQALKHVFDSVNK